MHHIVRRLLTTLALLTVAASVAWSTAHARPHPWNTSFHAYVQSSTGVVGVSRAGVSPANGEPDVGQTKVPLTITGRATQTLGEDDVPPDVMSWLSRISQMLMARYLGVR